MPIKKEKPPIIPSKCICGKMPVAVMGNRGKVMVACPDLINCALRSRWVNTEQAAADDWEVVVKEAKNREEGER